MKIVLVFVVIWLNCSAQSNQVATAVAMPLESNWVIGTTLDGFFESGKPSPFTRDSIAKFEKAFETTKIEEFGKFVMSSNIVSNQNEKMEAFGIGTSLSVSYMGFTV